jgi:hypothetical protein
MTLPAGGHRFGAAAFVFVMCYTLAAKSRSRRLKLVA